MQKDHCSQAREVQGAPKQQRRRKIEAGGQSRQRRRTAQKQKKGNWALPIGHKGKVGHRH